MALLTRLPESPEHTQFELNLQTALGAVCIVTKGHGAPEVSQAYARAHEICREIGEKPELFPVMIGLSRFYAVRAEFRTAHELGLQLLDLAQRVQDPTPLIGAYWSTWLPAFYWGELLEVYERTQRGLDLYDRQQHPAQVLLYGLDLGVACHEWAALSAWLLGYPDRARAHLHEGLSLAQELVHPYSAATAFVYAAWLHQLCGERTRTQEWAETAIARCAEQGFVYWLTMATIFRGWALADQSQSTCEAVEMLREGIATYRATGEEMACTYWLGLLGEVYSRQGQTEPALAAVSEALELMDRTGESFWEAELRRLQGEFLLLQSAEHHEKAESYFNQALDVACQQQAKSLELRATTSLARPWQSQDKCQDAYDLLAPIYNWFTEGFDTADLKDAKALLDELA